MLIEILKYSFMRRAFIAAICIAFVLPMIGNIIILKRLSSIGDTLSHASLAGVAISYLFKINILFGAILFCVISALLIELTHKKFSGYPEISNSIIMSFAVCLTAICSGLKQNNFNLNGFLFGSIIAISRLEICVIIILSILVMIIMLVLHKKLLYIVFNEESASISGIKVNMINFIFILLAAIAIGISSKIIGALVVSSVLILPVASAMNISKSYKNNLILSIIFALISNLIGLIFAYYFNLKPGGAIILFQLVIFYIIFFTKQIKIFNARD